MQTTLANILLHNPCGLDWRDGEGFAKLCMGLGFKPETGDLLSDFVANYPDPVSFTKMLDINGLHDTTENQQRQQRLRAFLFLRYC